MIYMDIVATLALVAIVVLIIEVRHNKRAREELIHEIQELRLKSRARVGQTGIQSGAVTQEQKLRRLGRASVGRRIVVGGDDDSQLKKDLTTYEPPEDQDG